MSENEQMEKKEQLIKRIVEEKGKDAIPVLIKLLYDEDSEVREIAAEALFRLGEPAKEALYEELKKLWEEGIEEDDITVLYIVDLLGDFKEKRAKDIFYSLLSKFTIEEAIIIIYEALAKIGEGVKLLNILEYLLLEDGDRTRYGDLVAMVLSYIDHPRSIEILKKAYFREEFEGEIKEYILRAMKNLIGRNPTYMTRIGKDIIKEMERLEWS
ncbi:MAG: HEAT repeat domain-containing protein [Thermotogaceae bacterium]|nr:HEAT repeat domain-containing protein [Thermotogaceae bacterium]